MLVVVLGLMLFLVGCESKQEKQLEGTWYLEDSDEVFITLKNGKIEAKNGEWGDYEVFKEDDDSIAITFYDEQDANKVDLNFVFDENDENKADVFGIVDDVRAPKLSLEKESSQGMSYPMRWFIFIGGAVAIYYILRAFINNKN